MNTAKVAPALPLIVACTLAAASGNAVPIVHAAPDRIVNDFPLIVRCWPA
ncbi:MAG TPA: hypothetical protein VGH81_13985 [Rudaea sp.]